MWSTDAEFSNSKIYIDKHPATQASHQLPAWHRSLACPQRSSETSMRTGHHKQCHTAGLPAATLTAADASCHRGRADYVCSSFPLTPNISFLCHLLLAVNLQDTIAASWTYWTIHLQIMIYEWQLSACKIVLLQQALILTPETQVLMVKFSLLLERRGCAHIFKNLDDSTIASRHNDLPICACLQNTEVFRQRAHPCSNRHDVKYASSDRTLKHSLECIKQLQ